MPRMHIYDNVNYAHYLPVYWSMLKNLDEDITAHMKAGYFSFSLTGKPFSGLPPDQTIEIKMNRRSKMKRGWTKFTQNSRSDRKSYIDREKRPCCFGKPEREYTRAL